MKLVPVVLDYESYWSTTHSLTKMNPIQYVTHPDTEIISVAAKFARHPTDVLFGEDNIRAAFSKIDWSDKVVIAHNNEGFDALISAWRFGVKPAMWLCTAAMARPRYSKTIVTMPDGKMRDGVSLAKLSVEFGLPMKGSLEATNTKGKHLKDFSPEEKESLRGYNIIDTENCYAIFERLRREISKDEMRLVDMTIRMIVEPQFILDVAMLERALREEKERKHLMLLDAATMVGADILGKTDDEIANEISKVLGSANKFAKLLKDLGVDPPLKISPTTGKETYALAKTDEGFLALANHEDPIIAAAANARLGVKSTLLETRIEAFLEAGRAAGGKLPVLLKYSGADTTQRWCLAEGMPVLVRDRNGVVFELPVQEVTIDYDVWDGENWVSHMGVEFSGDKEVITWQGVTATPEHIVWVNIDTKVPLGYAAANKLALWGGKRVPDIQDNLAVR